MVTKEHTDRFLRFFHGGRLRESRYARKELVHEAISDKNRIVFSSAYRRLQSKTQVFPLQKNDAVRTRLTHTCEVATIGQNLAYEIAVRLDLLRDYFTSFMLFVESVCLVHDIGNPPFGHFGEFAVQDWFRRKGPELCRVHKCSEKILSDFVNFDGNPQGFRTITRLQSVGEEAGLNLSATLLCSYLKYLDCQPSVEKPFSNKIGFFGTEQDIVKKARDMMSLGEGQRHPFTYIMEAADDIAFCFSDIEDGLEKGIFDYHYFYNQILAMVEMVLSDASSEIRENVRALLVKVMPALPVCFDDAGLFQFRTFKANLTAELVSRASCVFVENLPAILETTLTDGLLKVNENDRALLKLLRRFARDYVFRSKEAIDVELGGHEILTGILDRYYRLLLLTEDDFRRLSPSSPDTHKNGRFEVEKRLYYLLPSSQIQVYKDALFSVREKTPENGFELYHRMHLLVDFVAGMTDTYALKIFQLLHGIDPSSRS
jgi:dGTPase